MISQMWWGQNGLAAIPWVPRLTPQQSLCLCHIDLFLGMHTWSHACPHCPWVHNQPLPTPLSSPSRHFLQLPVCRFPTPLQSGITWAAWTILVPDCHLQRFWFQCLGHGLGLWSSKKPLQQANLNPWCHFSKSWCLKSSVELCLNGSSPSLSLGPWESACSFQHRCLNMYSTPTLPSCMLISSVGWGVGSVTCFFASPPPVGTHSWYSGYSCKPNWE